MRAWSPLAFFFFLCFFFRRRSFARVERVRFARLCARLRLGAVCAAGCCVRGSTLCPRLDTVCARSALFRESTRVLRLLVCVARFAQYFFFFVSHSETPMYFFVVQIAAYSCWLVAASAQVTMNEADASALNQMLTGFGCWQSSVCKAKNFNCNNFVVSCNANGSVTYL